MTTGLAVATLHVARLQLFASWAAPSANQEIIGTPLVVLALVVAAIITFVLNPRDSLVRIFTLLMLTAAVIVGVDPLFERHDVWGRAIDAAANGLGPALFLRFCLTFPYRQPRAVVEPVRWRRAMYTIGPIVPLVAALIYITLLPATGWLTNVAVVVICLGILFGLVSGLVMLGGTFLRNRSREVRGPILVVWLGAALTFVPLMALNVVPPLFFQPSLIPFSDSAYVLLILPIAVGFATMRWGPFSLTAFIDRASVYLALGGLLLALYAAITLLITRLEGVPFSPIAAAVSLALAVIAAATFAPARATIERGVDSLLYRDHYDLGATVQRFSRSLATIRDQNEVVASLLEDLCDTLKLRGAAFVPLPGGLSAEVLRLVQPGDLEARREFDSGAARNYLASQLAGADPARWQLRDQQPIVTNPWPGCAALVLIRGVSGEEYSSLLALGPKRGGGPLRAKDRVVLGTVAHQTSTALENAVLIGGLQTTLAQLRRSAEQLEAARAEQRLLLREVVDAEERQRADLARDLHDDALQDLLYVTRHSRYCASIIAPDRAPGESFVAQTERLRDELNQLAQAAAGAERKLRDLCAGLYPELLESLGLVAALETLADDLGAAESLDVTVRCEEGADLFAARIDEWTRLHAYRLVQEAVRNAARHAEGHHVVVHLAAGTSRRRASTRTTPPTFSRLIITISDDGHGMALPADYTALLRAGHLGLASMRERAERIAAELTLTQGDGGGLVVRLAIPISLAGMPSQPMARTDQANPAAVLSSDPAHGDARVAREGMPEDATVAPRVRQVHQTRPAFPAGDTRA